MSGSLSGCRAFVTGADGFIGSHLVEALVAQGAQVRALVYYNSWNTTGWLEDCDRHLIDQVEIVTGDVRDGEQMRTSIADCDYVFHLASLIAIPYSYAAPASYVQTNVLGTLNILQAARYSDKLKRVVHVSTSEVYGSAQTVPISETHPLVAQSPYAASKVGADKLAESFHLSFGLPVTTGRPFNTFGPRQTARAVIPTIASQLIARSGSLRIGALYPTRDFNFVGDTAAGLIALALSEEAEGETVNIGSGKEWSIAQTVDLLCEIIGHTPEILSEEARQRPADSEVARLIADTAKIGRLTGWQSSVPFRDGLERTVRWIERNIDKFDVDQYAR
ncbi:MAG: SDR family NAD(P)-dependent oxidoreductase [Rhizobiales bacterium]|nr:SDR family NAD(P)-dependent oxidoreductase [Hyphomicrobiales bacterium]